MARIGFIGLGNMGAPMFANLRKAGREAIGFDLSEPARQGAAAAGGQVAETAAVAIAGADVVVTALPAARHVAALLLGGDGSNQSGAVEEGLFASMAPGALVIDCSTIDPSSARTFAAEAARRGFSYVDSPMSGGVAGAEAGALTFMVGGAAGDFARAEPVLSSMGANIFHAGEVGAGSAAKICNNMLLAISMIGVCEAFNLAESLGLEAQKLYDIASTATGRCWSLNDYCPVPGPVPAAPSNRNYAPGFAAALMLKDLRLAMTAAQSVGAVTPLGAEATQLYAMMNVAGGEEFDFSGVIKMLQGQPFSAK